MSVPTSPYESPPTPSQPRSKTPWIILLCIGGTVLLVPCLCGGVFVALAGRGIVLAVSERENVEQVVNEYLQEMEEKSATAAYALFSPTAKLTIPQSELQKLLEEPGYGVFSQFQRASVTNIQVQTTPQRTVAIINGTVRYEGGTTGTFRGVVGREGEAWMIDGMHVSVPPSKMAKPK